ncbi:MAG: hypothetical protein RIS94_2527 [Pseudomonadota bacterium]|jgi:hypothetical protein
MRKSIAAVVVALGVGAALPALAQAVIVRSTGPSAPSYPPGTRLAAGAGVSLRNGDVVTVLDRAGTRVLKGAGNFTIDNAVNRTSATAALLARSLSNPASVRAGAVRGEGTTLPDEEPVPVSIWLADIDRAGTGGGRVCVPRGSDLYLWRGKADVRRFVWLGEADGGGTVRVAMPMGTSGVAWPKAMLGLSEGHRYRVTDEADNTKSVEFELVMLDPEAVPADAAGIGTLLLDNGCKAQFDALASAVERIDGQSGG